MSPEFTLVKRGYNPIEVDSYINSLEKQLNEYKEKSSAINNAIISAQVAADNIIKDAHSQTEKMLTKAESNALTLKQKTLSQISGLKVNISAQRKIYESFLNDYASLIKKYLTDVDKGESNALLSKLDEMDKLIDNLSTPERDAVAKIASDMPPAGFVSTPPSSPHSAAPNSGNMGASYLGQTSSMNSSASSAPATQTSSISTDIPSSQSSSATNPFSPGSAAASALSSSDQSFAYTPLSSSQSEPDRSTPYNNEIPKAGNANSSADSQVHEINESKDYRNLMPKEGNPYFNKSSDLYQELEDDNEFILSATERITSALTKEEVSTFMPNPKKDE